MPNRSTPPRIPGLPTTALALALAPAPLAAQADTVTVAAGEHYSAGGLHELVLGSDYRDLWTTPIRVPVLDPDAFAGGLEVLERGGGRQTLSLRLGGADGREYVFRSVDKDQTGGLPDDFKNTLIDAIAQDQVSSKHPGAALVAAPLLEAAGVLHATPRLFVMPDDPEFLGEHRAEFAGMLGMIEVRPNEDREEIDDGFAGAVRVAGTDRVFEHLEEDPDHRVASRAYLAARLMDFFLGDWDRHEDQWRWARFDEGDLHLWYPIPRDRDNAFVRYDGLLMGLVRRIAPLLVEFGTEYPGIYGLTQNAQALDRDFLSDLPAAVYDSTARALQRKLTDEVIDAAVARTPARYRELRGEELARALKARRDALPAVAREFYALLSSEVDVWATDERELAEVERLPDGAVEVRLFELDDERRVPEPGAEPYFRRRFLPGETNEVRIYLRGGDDRAVVRGRAEESVLVRVIGGGDDDLLADSSVVAGGGRTAFYDGRDDNRFVTDASTTVDTSEYERPDSVPFFTQPHRDWGGDRSWFTPWAAWRSNVGPVIGGGPGLTKYGFRRQPYAHRLSARALYAPWRGRFGVEAAADFRRPDSRSRLEVLARASQLQVTRFHGFGNETGDAGDDARYKVWETQYLLAPRWVLGLGESLELSAGPVVKYTDPEIEPGGPADLLRPFGTEAFGQLGGRAGLALDTRDSPAYPRQGLHLRMGASAYPAVWDVPGAFGGVEASAATYLPLPLGESVLALRAGGGAAWGDSPIQEAAYVGGAGSLRGYPLQRFLGEAAAFAGAEARTFLTRFNFISRGDLGALALLDVGRVWADGESSDMWHTGYGAGVWVGVLDRSRTASLVYAYGEEHGLYLMLGMPF